MASITTASAVDRHAAYNKSRIFILSVIALATAGINSATQTAIASDLQKTFFDPLDPLTSAQKIGSVLGVSFLGFAFTIAIGSPLLDYLGMGRLLTLSALCFITGSLTEIFASSITTGPDVYWVLFGAMILIGRNTPSLFGILTDNTDFTAVKLIAAV